MRRLLCLFLSLALAGCASSPAEPRYEIDRELQTEIAQKVAKYERIVTESMEGPKEESLTKLQHSG